MHLLNTITIALAGLMVGNELAISAFVNPAARQLEAGPRAQELSILARSLGRAMPVWYGVCLALLAIESYLHRNEAALAPLLTATLIWAGVIAFSIVFLVPINNRIGSLNAATPTPGWEREHNRWDALHRVRILLLIIAVLTLTCALVD